MKEEFDPSGGGEDRGRQVEPLVQLTTSGFCSHRSWGFGRIKTVDTVFAQFIIDFPGKTGHTMDLSFWRIPSSRFPRITSSPAKSVDLEGLQRPPRCIIWISSKVVLNSYGGKRRSTRSSKCSCRM